MRSVDDALLAAIRSTGATVHEGQPPTTSSPNVINSSTPFVVYRSGLGNEDEESRSMSGPTSTLSVPVRLTYVGVTPQQVKWLAAKVRARISGRMVGGERVMLDDSQREILPDMSAKLVDGSRLYYGVDDFLCGGVVSA